MEWQLPIQKVEIGNMNIGNPWARKESTQKPMAPLSYFGTHFRLPYVSLLFPPLTVIEYNIHTGKLVLDMSETSLACIKLNTLQETLVGAIVYHQYGWFKTDFTTQEVRQGFQPIFQDNQLLLHCPLGTPPSRSRGEGGRGFGQKPPMYESGKGWRETTPEDLKPGKRLRVAVKFHGISFLNRSDQKDDSSEMVWSGKCRIQHRIQGMLCMNS